MAIDSSNPPPYRPGQYVISVTDLVRAVFPSDDDRRLYHGPGAPVIRDVAVLVALYELASTLEHQELRQQVQAAVSRALKQRTQDVVELKSQPLPPGDSER